MLARVITSYSDPTNLLGVQLYISAITFQPFLENNHLHAHKKPIIHSVY